ncbi:hypothetical protein BCR42DRAFT_463039 [Absidia repens]|uniref:Uncharacterized protein n=1 Tax=Absidia repens TaxID=90262 RepID=A0A1X2I2S0_9FUNG|nr:hypothetical protein BCR42DRAFT_463039 [Absidia repens]
MSSVSWMAEKSSSDLIPMLKNAYHTLKDKERDLKLAAEIGKSLLENNIAMKNKYENLLNNTRSAPISTALPTPSSSIVTVSQQHGSDSRSEAYMRNGGSDNEDDEDNRSMRFVPSRSTREAMIEVLELKNTELNGHLETILEEQSHMDKSNSTKHRQLEQEVTALTDSLDIATSKIQELENMKSKANLQQPGGDDGEQSTDDHVDQQLVEELLEQIDNLKTKNDTAAQSKLDLESKLTHTLQDLRKLKQQFDHFQFTENDHEDLKAAYERQFRHIDELNSSVEEHRVILQKLKDKGVSVHSTHSSPAPSHVDGETGFYIDNTADEFRNTLLGDLENEWMQQRRLQQQQQQQQQRDHLHPSSSTPVGTSTSMTSQPIIPCMKPSLSTLSFNNLSKFTSESIASMYQQSESGMESVLARAAGVDQKTLEEAIRLVDHLENGFGRDASDNDDDKDDDDYLAWLLGQDERGSDSPLLDSGDTSTERNPQLWTMFDSDLPCDGLYPDASTRAPVNENDLMVGSSNTFSGRIQNTVRFFFKAVWRWCRFAAILTTAVLINLWNGPDSMLLQN